MAVAQPRLPLRQRIAVRPDAVLLDMDGTLLDSEKLWDIALNDAAQWLGGTLSARARQRMVGSSMGRSVAILHDDLGIDADPESSAAYLTQRTEELFHTSLVWRPGAQELLMDLQAAGMPTALVTATHRRLTEVALDTLGRQYFGVTICGDEVGHPKPDPEPYRTAAQRLDADPRECIVVEDSPLGIASAEAAGCFVVAVPSEMPIEPGPGRVVIPTLSGVGLRELEQLALGRQLG